MQLTSATLVLLLGATPAPLTIQSPGDGRQIVVQATLPSAMAAMLPEGNLSADVGERWLRLTLVAEESAGDEVPILGAYQRRGDRLTFQPRHLLLHGQRYRATLTIPGRQPVRIEHAVPARPASAPAVVEHIFPSESELPENLLKFYLHFSKPMRPTDAIFEQIELRTEDGKPVTAPWRRTELWSEDGKRLTLWIHPGRVKEGISLREALGPVLTAGKTYELILGAELQDEDGQRLGKEFVKRFRAVASLRSRPQPTAWELQPPRIGTRDPLTVRFDRPLDRWLLTRFLVVLDASGEELDGRIEVTSGERVWRFHPVRPWRDADYQLQVDERLEDVAGNTPARLFDVDLRAAQPAPPVLSRSFRPMP
jgi:hypothetical protein